MSETVTNLKVRFGADTKNFKADLESGKAAVTNFTGAAGGAFEQFAAVFGINMGAITGRISSANKSLSLLSGGFKGTTEAVKIFGVSWKIALGPIGLFIIALGALVNYFTKTERGAEAVERVMASFKAVVNVLIDRFAILGEGIYKLFTGDFKGGWDAMKKSVAGVGTEIMKEAGQARELEIALQKLEDREIALIEVQGKRRQAIAELRLAAKDEDKSTKEKLAAMSEAIRIQKQVTADEVSLQKERTRIFEAQTKMGEIMDDDNRAMAESRATLNDLEAAGSNEIRGMSREYNKLSKELTSETEKLNKETDAVRLNRIEKEKSDSKDLSPIAAYKIPVEWKVVTDSKGKKDLVQDIDSLFQTDKLETKAAKIQNIYGGMKTSVMDFSSVFSESMSGAATAFGESIGQMLAGSASFEDLGAIVGKSLGTMAIQVGQIAIATGIATIGIKAALESLNPALAIAGGIALVALGSWVSSSMGSAASGTGTYSGGGSSYDTTGGASAVTPGSVRSAPMTINITGSFVAQGRDLVAVIDKNAQRKYITT